MTLRRALPAVALLAALCACSGGSGAPTAAGSHPADRSSGPAGTARATASPRLRVGVAGWRLPSARSREVVLPYAGGLLVAGGLDATGTSTNTVWLLAAGDGRLRSAGRLATAVHDASGFVLGGAPYVAAGGNATTISEVQRLSPDGVATESGRLPQPRSDLVAVTSAGGAFVLGGFDGTSSLPQVLRTSDGRRFAAVANLALTVRYAAAAFVGGRILVFGGEHDGVSTSVVQAVDPAGGRTRVIGHLPRPLSHACAFVLGGDVWLAGGRSDGVLQSRVWRWDLRRSRAVSAGRLPYAVADASCAVTGGVGYLLGGETPDKTDRVMVLRPAAG